MKKLSSKKKTDPWPVYCLHNQQNLPGQLFTKIDHRNAEIPQDVLFWTNSTKTNPVNFLRK